MAEVSVDFRLRAARASDADALLSIVNDAILNSTAMYESAPRTLGAQQAWFDDKVAAGWPVIVAEDANGRVCGFGSMGPFRTRSAYRKTAEHSVYVDAAARGRGIGRLILEALIEEARARSFHSLIGGVDSENEGSLGFHRALGFEEVGRMNEVGWKFDRWLTLIFVQKML